MKCTSETKEMSDDRGYFYFVPFFEDRIYTQSSVNNKASR